MEDGTLDDAIRAANDKTCELLRSMKRVAALHEARANAEQEQWGEAIAAVAGWAEDPTSDEAAVEALAATRLAIDENRGPAVLADAETKVDRAETLAAEHRPTWDFTYEFLAEARAALGDGEGAARHWRAYLESQDPVIAVGVTLLAKDRLGSMAQHPAIIAVNREFSTFGKDSKKASAE